VSREPKSDVLIIGAGIVGLSIGIALLQARSSLRIHIVDKESGPGQHASGRNSGVLHAGFYYSPDSLKAQFCREGNLELKKLCIENEIPVLECGKVVVATDAEEDARLDLLYSRGITNGVELEIHDANLLEKYEPLARTYSRFLWSPNTSISDPRAVTNAMVKNFEELGGRISYGAEVSLGESSGEICVKGFETQYVINSAGAQADRLARSLGITKEYAMVPFMGIYRYVDSQKLPLNRLVYPVPHTISPFLGVHFTITLDKKVKIGPTAIPILGREQYSLTSGWTLSDIGQALLATCALIRGDAHSLGKILKSELPKVRQRSLVTESARLVPRASEIKNWKKKPPGIRSQLVNIKSGQLEQDFIVENYQNSTHILNAVSPGWTSALPFGKWIVANHVLKNL